MVVLVLSSGTGLETSQEMGLQLEKIHWNWWSVTRDIGLPKLSARSCLRQSDNLVYLKLAFKQCMLTMHPTINDPIKAVLHVPLRFQVKPQITSYD